MSGCTTADLVIEHNREAVLGLEFCERKEILMTSTRATVGYHNSRSTSGEVANYIVVS